MFRFGGLLGLGFCFCVEATLGEDELAQGVEISAGPFCSHFSAMLHSLSPSQARSPPLLLLVVSFSSFLFVFGLWGFGFALIGCRIWMPFSKVLVLMALLIYWNLGAIRNFLSCVVFVLTSRFCFCLFIYLFFSLWVREGLMSVFLKRGGGGGWFHTSTCNALSISVVVWENNSGRSMDMFHHHWIVVLLSVNWATVINPKMARSNLRVKNMDANVNWLCFT